MFGKIDRRKKSLLDTVSACTKDLLHQAEKKFIEAHLIAFHPVLSAYKTMFEITWLQERYNIKKEIAIKARNRDITHKNLYEIITGLRLVITRYTPSKGKGDKINDAILGAAIEGTNMAMILYNTYVKERFKLDVPIIKLGKKAQTEYERKLEKYKNAKEDNSSKIKTLIYHMLLKERFDAQIENVKAACFGTADNNGAHLKFIRDKIHDALSSYNSKAQHTLRANVERIPKNLPEEPEKDMSGRPTRRITRIMPSKRKPLESAPLKPGWTKKARN